KSAYELIWCLDFRRVLFRSPRLQADQEEPVLRVPRARRRFGRDGERIGPMRIGIIEREVVDQFFDAHRVARRPLASGEIAPHVEMGRASWSGEVRERAGASA